MDHWSIENENVAERYVAGKLPADEAAGFEEHYLDCPECIARVEDAARLHRGLQRVALEEATATARRLSLAGILTALIRSRQGALGLTVLLALVALPAALGVWQIGRLRHDLQAARRPQGNTAVYPLSPFRSSALDPGPVHPIPLPAQPGWIVLSLETGAGYPSYRATLLGTGDRVLWQASGLQPDPSGSVHLSLHSTFLSPGDYVLRLEGLSQSGEPAPVARFPLRVTRLQ
jgi:hypothetical protein